jgi:hypothetical protein
MKQQALLLEVESDGRFSHFGVDVQHAVIELMAALIIQVHTLSEELEHEHPAERE